MHHLLLDMGLSHRGVSLTLYSVNIFFIMVALMLRHISSLVLLIILLFLAVIFSMLPYVIKAYSNKTRPVDMKTL